MLKQTKDYINSNKLIEKYEKIIDENIPHKQANNIYINYFITNIINNIKCIYSYPKEIFKIKSYINKYKNLKKESYYKKKCLILGNGPSQGYISKKSLIKFKNNGNKIFVINYFLNNEIFKEVIPDFFIFSDPYTLNKNTYQLKSLSKKYRLKLIKQNKEIFQYLKENTSIKIMCPIDNYNNSDLSKLKNSYIPTINSYFNFIKFDNPLLPRSYPSLTIFHAIRIALYMNFNKNYLLGMDNNHFKNIFNDKNNKVWTLESHTTSSSYWFSKSIGNYSVSKTLFHISTILNSASKCFKKKNIINLDIFSLTDAFKKINLPPNKIDKIIER